MRGWWVCLVVAMACNSPTAAIDGGIGDASADAMDAIDAMDAVDAPPDGAPAALAIVSDYNDVGSVSIGFTSVPINVTVTNTGGAPTGTLVTSIQATPTQFAISADSCNGVTLAAATSCAFQVHFIPVAAGNATAIVRVDDTAVNAMKELYGTAVHSHEYKTVSPNVKDFGSVAIGATTASTTFTVMNAGIMTHGPITLALEGASPTAYTIVDDACTNVQLAGGTTCTFGVTFTPNASGNAFAHVTLTSIGGTVVAGLRGIGLDPKLRIDLASREYGLVAEDAHSEYARFDITNIAASATGSLTTTIIGMHPNDFVIATASDTCAAQTLAPGATCSIDVRFEPTAIQYRSARLRVADSTNAAVADLFGQAGTPGLFDISPTPFSFGDVPLGQASAARTFVITNRDVPRTLDPVYGSVVFQVSNDTCSNVTLATNASCSFDVTAHPTTLGYYEATVGSVPYSGVLVRGVP